MSYANTIIWCTSRAATGDAWLLRTPRQDQSKEPPEPRQDQALLGVLLWWTAQTPTEGLMNLFTNNSLNPEKALFLPMAISSPPFPTLSPLSIVFSEQRGREFLPKASRDFGFSSSPQPNIKRQNHLRKKLSNTKFSHDFSAKQPIQSDVSFGSDEGFEKKGAKHAASRMRVEESSNSQLEDFVREEQGIGDPFGAPNCGLEVKTEEESTDRILMHSVPSEETGQTSCATDLNREEQSKTNRQEHNCNSISTHQNEESKISFSTSSGNGEITGEEPWWYHLPCVLGILLCGGESDSAPEGLYSLEISNSSNENPMSYAITFEGRADATNFCYVLDSFFDGLNDVSAEVIPLMIQEMKEELQLGRLNVIVIPKGKLKLYAGQPLEEVESALRSFVD